MRLSSELGLIYMDINSYGHSGPWAERPGLSPQHCRSKKIKAYLKRNGDTMIVEYLPKGSPDLSAVEGCWKQGKDDLLVSKYYPRFTNLKTAITNYYGTKRFSLNIIKYLLRESTNLC